jgi:hypothetical protein
MKRRKPKIIKDKEEAGRMGGVGISGAGWRGGVGCEQALGRLAELRLRGGGVESLWRCR